MVPMAEDRVEVPLTEEQLGLLHTLRLEPDSATYHVPLAFEANGHLDIDTLRSALKVLARRHPLLTAVPGDTSLWCDPSRKIPFAVRETPGISAEEAEEALMAEAATAVDWDANGLCRVVVMRAERDRHYLLMIAHHLVLDGESAAIVATDLWHGYATLIAEPQPVSRDAGAQGAQGDAEAVVPDTPAVIAAAERRAAAVATTGLEDYWREALAGCESCQLPEDGAPRTIESKTGSVPIVFSSDVLARFARSHRLSLFAVLLAAYQRTLTRYARCRRVAVSVPVSTRDDPSLDGVVGCFINTVLVGSPGDDGLAAADYAHAVQRTTAGAIDHAGLPYRRIAACAGDTTIGSNCTFTFQSWYVGETAGTVVPGLEIRRLDAVHQAVIGDLTLELFHADDMVRGRLRYSTALWASQTAAAFTAQLVATAQAMAGEPSVAMTHLEDVRVEFGRTDCEFDRDIDLDRMLREASRRYADLPALVTGETTVTYRRLDELVKTAAAGMRRRGVVPGQRVCIWLPRGIDQVVCVLATLRTGAVFVPLEPDHPATRLESIVSQVRPALVVRDRSALPTPGGYPDADLTELWDFGRLALSEGSGVEVASARPDEPAYVLFTSGSSGVPKGVVVGHRALVNNMCWAHRRFAMGPDDVMAFVGALSFDITVHQLLAALTCGARLAIVPPGEQLDPEALACTLREERVTMMHLVPALLQVLVEEPAFALNSSLRAVISVGEALSNRLRRRFQEVQEAVLYNGYGPTEATMYATLFDCTTGGGTNDARWAAQLDVPIGAALDNVRCYVLDEHLRPVPAGAPGELCLAGVALAHGYLDDPEWTARQFPTLSLAGRRERTYRTGDLVRTLPDEGLSYLGRLDHQVKLNGYRVELGEVENALLAVPTVSQAVAVMHRHDDGHGQLIGYVTPAHVDPREVRDLVADRLPPYMVPVQVVPLDHLPHLVNGKLDRGALLAAGAPSSRTVDRWSAALGSNAETSTGAKGIARRAEDPQRDCVLAPTRVLEILRRCWAEVLGQSPAGDDAHFFVDGGDSILAMRLVSELRRSGMALPLRQLHHTPVLSELAAFLAADAGLVDDATADPSAGVSDAPEAALLAPMQRWFLDTVRTDREHWNQSVLLELRRPVEPQLIQLALQAVVLSHPVLSSRFEGDRMEQVRPFSALSAVALMDHVRVSGHEQWREALAAGRRGLDPAAGAMVRATYLSIEGDRPDQLLVVVHHLVVDDVSWRVLLDDLASAVEDLRVGVLPMLPSEGLAFSNWVERLAGPASEARAAQPWLDMVARRVNATGTLLMGTLGREEDSHVVSFELEPSSTDRLLTRLPAQLGIPVHETFTGLVALAVARWRGCPMVALDVEIHGRGGAGWDVSRTVGWFTAVQPTVVAVERAQPPVSALRTMAAHLMPVPEEAPSFGACLQHAAPGDRAELAACSAALVGVNYRGKFTRDLPGNTLRIVELGSLEDRSLRAERAHAVEVYGTVIDGRATIGVSWAQDSVDGVDEPAVTALVGQLRTVMVQAVEAVSFVPEPVPLTAAQRGIMMDALARRESDRYVEQLSWAWHGPLDRVRFKEAWRQVAEKHEALRARLDSSEEPSLVFDGAFDPVLHIDTAGSLQQMIDDERAAGFDLYTTPLWRLTLRPEPDGWQVLLTFHHLLLDGWSVALVVADFYRAYLGAAMRTAVGSVDLRTYARWLAERDLPAARRFWASSLSRLTNASAPGLPAPEGDLSTTNGSDAPDTTARSGDAVTGRIEVSLTAEGFAAAREIARRSAITDSTLFQTIWAALLWRLSGRKREATVSFGVTLSGRGIDLPGVSELVGMLMTTLPLSVQVRPDDSLIELALRIRDEMLRISAYEWASTGQVHGWSGRPGGQPLFESLLVMENYPQHVEGIGDLLREAGISVDPPVALGAHTAYPCTMLLHREGDQYRLTLVHDSQVFDEQAARKLAAVWQHVTDRASGFATMTVADLVGDLDDQDLPVLAAHGRSHAGAVVVASDSGRAAASSCSESVACVSGNREPQVWPVGPHTEKVRESWRQVFGSDEVGPQDNFFALGGHSLLAGQLVNVISERCGVMVRLDDLLTSPTAAGFAAAVNALSDPGLDAQRDHMVPLCGDGTPTLYLFHPPGGQVACYGELARRYQGPGSVVGIRDPRLDRPGDPQPQSVGDIARVYAQALLPRIGPGPVLLGGYSGGGTIAYEVARMLSKDTGRAGLVILLDTPAPTGDVTDTGAEGSFSSLVRAYDHHRRTGCPLDERLSGNAYLTELAAVADWMRDRDQSDPFSLLAVTLEAVERYRPEPFGGRVELCVAAETDFGKGTTFEPDGPLRRTPGLGWESYCRDLAVHTVPGNHVSMLAGDSARVLAATVADIVQKYLGGKC